MKSVLLEKRNLILSGLLVFGIILRLWNLSQIPVGFYSDEALYGYEAYSLMLTGKDQFGNKWPISIAGFGDYRPAFYIYFTIPFIKIFGLSEFATRIPSVITSCLTLFMTFLLARKLTKNTKVALFSLFLLVISPWSIFFARMAHETNLMTLLIISGIYFLIKSQFKLRYVFLSMLLFALSMYTYHTARIFVLLSLFFSVIFFHTYIRKRKKVLIFSLLFLAIVLIPLLNELKENTGWSRVNSIGIWKDPALVANTNEKRGLIQAQGVNKFVSRLIFNKGTILGFTLLHNLLEHFSPQFLFTYGDPNGIYNVPNTGILLWLEPVLILIGVYFLWQKQRQLMYWIITIILIGLMPDSLTRVGPSSARIHVVGPLVSILGGLGCYYLGKSTKQALFLVFILISLNSLWFWHNYIVVLPMVHEQARQIGTKEMVVKSASYISKFHQIWISRSGWGWIHLAFHLRYDPIQMQKEITVSPRNEFGFWWVHDVGKYHMDWFPKIFNEHTLYIGRPDEFPLRTKPLDSVRNNDHEIYWFVDGKVLQG